MKNRPGFDAFTQLSPEQQEALLHSITVLDEAPTVLDIEAKIKQELKGSVRKNFLHALATRLEGWWYLRVVQHLARKDNGVILGREIEDQRIRLQEQLRDDNLPVDYETLQLTEEILKQLEDRPFIEQLKLIALTDNRTQYAIRDYHRAWTQRSRWVRDELLLLGDLGQYEEKLLEEWELAFDRIKQKAGFHEDLSEQQKAAVGRDVYDWAEATSIPIRRECTTPYVTRGTFHILANKLALGWHPEFTTRLEHLSAALT